MIEFTIHAVVEKGETVDQVKQQIVAFLGVALGKVAFLPDAPAADGRVALLGNGGSTEIEHGGKALAETTTRRKPRRTNAQIAADNALQAEAEAAHAAATGNGAADDMQHAGEDDVMGDDEPAVEDDDAELFGDTGEAEPAGSPAPTPAASAAPERTKRPDGRTARKERLDAMSVEETLGFDPVLPDKSPAVTRDDLMLAGRNLLGKKGPTAVTAVLKVHGFDKLSGVPDHAYKAVHLDLVEAIAK